MTGGPRHDAQDGGACTPLRPHPHICAASTSAGPGGRDRRMIPAPTAPAVDADDEPVRPAQSQRQARIVFDGEDITRVTAHEIAATALPLVPEGRRIFRMTVIGTCRWAPRTPTDQLRRRHRACSRYSRSAGTPGCRRRTIERRRRIAGDRPRAEPPQAAARRKPSATSADLHPQDLPDRQGAQPRPRRPSCWSEQNANQACAWPTAAMCCNAARSPLAGTEGRNCWRSPEVRAAYLEGSHA